MLEKVWIVITEEDEKTEEQAKRLKKRLQSEGLEAGMEPFFSDSRKPQPAAGELYLTDCPEAVGRLAGENCRILLYLTEKSRKLSMTEYPYAVEDLEEIDAGYLEGIYRRLAGEPWEILRTKRLLVREQREEDLDSLYEINAHPDMTAYMEGLAVDREEEGNGCEAISAPFILCTASACGCWKKETETASAGRAFSGGKKQSCRNLVLP